MNRKAYILTLLYLSWGMYNVHRFWNNTEPVYVYPFPLDKDYEVTWHWYIYLLLKDLSYLLILLALWLYVSRGMRKDKEIMGVFGAVFVVQLIEIPHYLLWARHSEQVLFIEGLILVWSAVKLLRIKYKTLWTALLNFMNSSLGLLLLYLLFLLAVIILVICRAR